ncbi:MAG: serine hydrolase domain-containing protein [Verrucomicrobiales bacterium]
MSFWTDFPRTAAFLEQDRAGGFHIGGQIYISQRGKVVLSSAFGAAAEYIDMEEDSLMLWLSSGKPLTAICMALLQERGELALQDKVTKFIPEFATGGKSEITLAHILTHTGGFRVADKISPLNDWASTIEKICAASLEPQWPIGQKAGYHVSGSWFILGEIIQRTVGLPFTAFLRTHLLEPLGMFHTWNGISESQQQAYGKKLVVMHNTVLQPPEPMPLETSAFVAQPRPGSNTRGPISELGKFYEMLLHEGAVDGRQFISPATVALFVSPQRVGMYDQTFMHPMDWSYGFLVNGRKDLVKTMPYSFGRHASPHTFGHGGAQSSSGFCDPVNSLVVAWALNGMAGEKHHNRRARELNTAIYEDLALSEKKEEKVEKL